MIHIEIRDIFDIAIVGLLLFYLYKIMKQAIISKDIDYAVENNQLGTLTIKIGDNFEMGVQGYHNLKKWIEKHGGNPQNKLF